MMDLIVTLVQWWVLSSVLGWVAGMILAVLVVALGATIGTLLDWHDRNWRGDND